MTRRGVGGEMEMEAEGDFENDIDMDMDSLAEGEMRHEESVFTDES